MKLLRQLKQQDKKWIALAFLLIIGIPVAYVGTQVSLQEYYIFDELTLSLEIYGDTIDGDLRLITVEGDRIYTTLRVDVVADHLDGLDSVRASLHYDDDGTIGERLTSEIMPEVVAERFRVDFDVQGFAFGYYWVCIGALASMHLETWKNPDYERYWIAWNKLSPEEQEGEKANWHDADEHPDEPDEWITEAKNDVGIAIPDSRRVFVENPSTPMQVSFTMVKTDGTPASGTIDYPVKFDFDVITGSLCSYTFVIDEGAGYDNEVARLSDPALDTFVFNEGGLQANGEYRARIFFTGNRGWKGGNREITFTINNIEEITGIVEIYIVENGNWVIADYILKGDVKIVVHSVTGNPSEVGVSLGVTFDGQGGFYEYYLEYDETNDEYSVIINLQKIPNGLYDVVVYAIRAEDGAICYLSAFDFSSAGTGKVDDRILLGLVVIGIVMFLAIIMIKRRGLPNRKRGVR